MTSDCERAHEALAFVPNHDRDLWVRMAMALKSEFSDAGFDLWDEWSQGADNYDPAAGRAVWKGIKEGGGITIASLFFEAKANGWVPTGNHQPSPPTAEDLAERERRDREAREASDRDAQQAALWAARLWKLRTKADNMPYLERKGLGATETLGALKSDEVVRIIGYQPCRGDEPLNGPLLLVPIKVGDSITSMELIDAKGRKTSLRGGRTRGGYWVPAPLPADLGGTLYVGEGMATVLAVWHATGSPSIAARYVGNVRFVAEALRERYPDASIVILGEVGSLDKHAAAARAVGGKLWTPDFREAA